MALDREGWAAIRRAYEETDESAAAMARRFPVAADTIRRRAKREGWSRKVAAVASRHRRESATTGKPERRTSAPPSQPAGARRPAGGKPADRATLLRRLYDAIDAKLQQLEARMASGHELTAADSERETRELGSMIRSFEKVTAFASAIEGRRETGAKRSGGPAISAGDAERMREEIAERLDRLCQDRPAAPQSGAPE